MRFEIRKIVKRVDGNRELYGERGEMALMSEGEVLEQKPDVGAFYVEEQGARYIDHPVRPGERELAPAKDPVKVVSTMNSHIEEGEIVELPGRNIIQTECSMLFSPDCSYKQWHEKGAKMQTLAEVSHKHLRWWVGDWILHGQTQWPDAYSQALGEWAYGYGSLRNCVYVCRNVAKDVRVSSLSFEHHYMIASMPREKQEYWLKQADLNRWSLAEFREILRGKGEIKEKAEKIEEPAPKVESGWVYENYEAFEARNCYLYPQKTVHQIAELAFNESRKRKE